VMERLVLRESPFPRYLAAGRATAMYRE